MAGLIGYSPSWTVAVSCFRPRYFSDAVIGWVNVYGIEPDRPYCHSILIGAEDASRLYIGPTVVLSSAMQLTNGDISYCRKRMFRTWLNWGINGPIKAAVYMTVYIKPGPHQQQCQSNVRLCCQKRQQCRTRFALKFRPFDKVEGCFDIVAQNGNIVEATDNKVALRQCCFDIVVSVDRV